MQRFGPYQPQAESFYLPSLEPTFLEDQDVERERHLDQTPQENRIRVLFRSTISWISLICESMIEQGLVSLPLENKVDLEFQDAMSYILENLKPIYPQKTLQHLQTQNIPSFLKHPEKEVLITFIKKLSCSADFKHPHTRSVSFYNLSIILKKAFENKTFCKDILIPLAFEATESCVDRTAITFNRLCLEKTIHDLGETRHPKDLTKILIGYARLQLLHEEAVSFCQKKGFKDEIQVMLFLQTQLRNTLDLPLTVVSMEFPSIAGINSHELKEIKKKIASESFPRLRKIQILNKELTPTYDEKGKVISYGNLSPTNPYLLNISEIWSKFLKTKFSHEFQKIEIDENMLFDPKALLNMKEQERNIQLLLTKKIINNPPSKIFKIQS